MTPEMQERLEAMTDSEKADRLEQLNERVGVTAPEKSKEFSLEDLEEREWLKQALGY